MKLRIFDLVGMVFVALWVGWAVWYFSLGESPVEAERIVLSPEEAKEGWRSGVEWQGIYLKDKKVGYLRLKKWKEGESYRMKSDMLLYLTVMKTRQKIETEVDAHLTPDMVIRQFQMDVSSGVAETSISGRVNGQEVTVEIESGGSTQRNTLPLKEPPRLSFALKSLLLKEKPEPGKKISLGFFDPASMTERSLVVEYLGTEKILVMGQEVEAHRFAQEMGGKKLMLWTNAIGEVLREELPMGLVGVRESGAQARYGLLSGDTGGEEEDLVDAVSVTPSGGAFPGSSTRARVRLSGLDFEGLDLHGGRQAWTPENKAGALLLQVETRQSLIDRRAFTLAQVKERVLSSAELSPYVLPEMMVQSDHAQIHRRAEGIMERSERSLQSVSVLEISEKISTWVYDTLTKESVVGVPSALETLKNLRGDCNEHSTLTVALLRSIGVPARIAVGIAYLPDKKRFFYHAWVEVWTEGWIAIDPTFGQFPADVGHIRFVAGGLQEQVEMFRVIGQLRLQTLEEP